MGFTDTTVPRLGGSPDLAGALSPAASLFHSLSDPTRLAILRHLSVQEHRVVDLTSLGPGAVDRLGPPRLPTRLRSRHAPASGPSLDVSLTAEPELLGVLAVAERLLEVTGDAVDLCPTYGTAVRTEGDER